MENKLQHTCATTREFALQLLEHITNNFSEERIIGRGGYGVVYKGVLEDGQEIAVKKLHHMPGLDDKQFRNEFNNFMRAQHQNIVRLVGYCYDIGHQRIKHNGEYIFAHVEERLLCFEYLQGGSLDKHVSDESCRLDWPSCYKIIKGVCEGLNYLHNGSKDPMYHLDLKPANILLDKDMTPKIGDFGLSRLFPSAHTHITTKIVGTRGYMPPEYIDRYQITPKFDVFSLGVIIIQIMAGRVGYSKCADIPSQEFIKLVHENWRKKMQPTMLSHTSQGVKTCIEIALRCVETDRVKRPTIAEIVNELNKIYTTIVVELNEFDDTKRSPIAQWRSLERKLGGLMHKVSDLRSKQAFNQYASSGGRLLPLPETLLAKPLQGHVYSHYLRRRNLRKKWVRWLLLLLSVVGWSITCFWFFLSQNSMQVEVHRKSLASMCDQYASMVQDQFSVSMYYLQALAILVSTFHHSQNPSAIDQTTFAWYAERTAFERLLTSGVAYAERGQGWSTTKLLWSKNKSRGRWDAAAAEIRQPAEEYAPVIFAQYSNEHVLSFDILSDGIVLMVDEFYSRQLRGEIDGAIWEGSQNFSSIGEQPSQIEELSVYYFHIVLMADGFYSRPWKRGEIDDAAWEFYSRPWRRGEIDDATWEDSQNFSSIGEQLSQFEEPSVYYLQIVLMADEIYSRLWRGEIDDATWEFYSRSWRRGEIDDTTWENSQNFSSIGEQPSQIEETSVYLRPKNKRSKTEQEDDLLVQAWLHTSLDAATSKEQTRDSYWAMIHHYFHNNKQSVSVCNQNSLSNYWGTIQEQVNKLCGCYDWQNRALAMEEKMMALQESKQAIEKNKIALEQQKLDFERRSDDERIMSMDVSAMTEPQQQYYINLQREIIAWRYSTMG